MRQKKLLSVLLAGAMVVSGGSISGLEGIIPEVAAAASSTEWNGQPGVFQVNREAARATFYSFDTAEKAKAKDQTKSSFYKLLNGDDWKFSWAVKPSDRIGVKDANFNQKDYDDSSWDDITVPKSWQTYVKEDGSWKYDPVIYSNQNYPWMNAEGKNYSQYKVGDAPTECNPVGTYRKTFTIDSSWKDRNVFINFEGVGSAMYLWVNGKYIGYAEDSFTRDEFNITDALDFSEGNKNVITVEVYRWSDGSYIENQDMVRLSGIFRDVYLTSKDDVEIRDYTVVTDLDETYTDADLNIDVDVRNLSAEDVNGWSVEGNLYDSDGKRVTTTPLTGTVTSFDSETKEAKVNLTQHIIDPEKWSAEKPNLYNLVLELKKDGVTKEATQTDVGFREVEITDANTDNARLRVNGQVITIAGVNRHENDPQDGWYLTEEDMRKDIELMKSLNIKLSGRVLRKIVPIYESNNKEELYSKIGAGIIDLKDLDKVLKVNSKSKILKFWTLFINKKEDEEGDDPAAINDAGETAPNAAHPAKEQPETPQFEIAECCKPIPGDKVVGYRDPKTGNIIVHKATCDELNRLATQFGRNIVKEEIKWSQHKAMSYLVTIELRGIDRMGILLDLAKVVSADFSINIREVGIHSHDGIFEGSISLYVKDAEGLQDVMTKLRKIKGIESVKRTLS